MSCFPEVESLIDKIQQGLLDPKISKGVVSKGKELRKYMVEVKKLLTIISKELIANEKEAKRGRADKLPKLEKKIKNIKKVKEEAAAYRKLKKEQKVKETVLEDGKYPQGDVDESEQTYTEYVSDSSDDELED